jgi:hypothetical protein
VAAGILPTMTAAKLSWGTRFRITYWAIMASILLVVTTGLITDFGKWYSTDVAYRRQTDAFLRGHIALSDSPAAIMHDYCWVNGGMQQVWGLGVPAWRLPFEVLSKLCGYSDFPDRVTFAFAYALAAWLIIKAFTGTPGTDLQSGESSATHSWYTSVGSIAILLAFPPFITLCRTRFAVYEEAVAYTFLYGICLFAGLLIFESKRSLRWYLFLALGSGLAPFVRPTLAFYGGATCTLAVWLAWGWGFRRREIVLGLVIYLGAFSLLFLTNWQRFGSPLEFGHSLNFSDVHIRYATRFENPYRHEPTLSASRELWGSLFNVKEFTHNYNWYQPNLFWGQSPSPRWRETYFSTFDLSFAAFISVAWVLGGRTLLNTLRRHRRPTLFELCTVWSMVPTIPLLVFYLHSPFITSRYMLDFAPAFAIALAGLWIYVARFLGRRSGPMGCTLLVGWIAVEIGSAQIEPDHLREPTYAAYVDVHARQQNGAVLSLPGEYRLDAEANQNMVLPGGNENWSFQFGKREPMIFPRAGGKYPSRSLEIFGIPHNGNGWDLNSGTTEPMATVFVDSPVEVAVDVVPINGIQISESYYNSIRAKVGLEELKRKSVLDTIPGKRIVFYGPSKAHYQTGIQVLFLSMMPPEDLGRKPLSNLRLTRIAWTKLSVHALSSVSRIENPIAAAESSRSGPLRGATIEESLAKETGGR